LKIECIEAIPIEVPLARPLKMAVATVDARTCIVVRVTTDDGIVGIGESVVARYFTGESLASASDIIGGVFADALIGRDPTDLVAIRRLMRRIAVHNNGARAAVEMALHDVVARAVDLPLHVFYGGRARDSVPTIWHVSGGTPESMAEEAAIAVDDGFPLVKVKVGGDVDHDIATTLAVRQAIGHEIELLPDANQGWDLPTADHYLRAVADAQPGFVEQPLPCWDLMGMARLVATSPVTVAGDEGVFDANELRTALAVGAAGAVVAKLMKAAGPIGVREVFAVADAAGIGVHFAGMAGQTSISAAHAAHLALVVPNLRYGSGISPHYLVEDVTTERFLPVAGHLYPSDEPGVGIEIDEEALTRFRVDR
jgi:muconate cycloisomerase|tara:strand:+ start:4361 stop:5464 length:1104 start_codon:yes stop_codon:yes gene_type:complete